MLDLNCVVFGPSVVAVVSIYWAATGYGTETGEPLLAMTKKDRQSLFGLRHLFAEREAVRTRVEWNTRQRGSERVQKRGETRMERKRDIQGERAT